MLESFLTMLLASKMLGRNPGSKGAGRSTRLSKLDVYALARSVVDGVHDIVHVVHQLAAGAHRAACCAGHRPCRLRPGRGCGCHSRGSVASRVFSPLRRRTRTGPPNMLGSLQVSTPSVP